MMYYRFLFLAICIALMLPRQLHSQSTGLISTFDLATYNQNLDDFISPQSPGYDTRLIDEQTQKIRTQELYDHFFGVLSPWQKDYVDSILDIQAPGDLVSWERKMVETYSNKGKSGTKIGYGSNFRPHPESWAEKIAENMNFERLEKQMKFSSHRRAIAVTNLHCRVLPTDDVHFYSHTLAGEGYPFDNLQNSALWMGTPVYRLTASRDKQWSLVLTPDFIGWVKSDGLAFIDESTIRFWKKAMHHQPIAIIKPQTIIRSSDGSTSYTAYTGSLFPAAPCWKNDSLQHILVATRGFGGRAQIVSAQVSVHNSAPLPIAATPRNFCTIIKAALGRQYGWGNMYFYNDCSAELKCLYAPFGIYLARNSAYQAASGRQMDLSASSMDARVSGLLQHGKAFTTIFFIGGHVITYLGPTMVDGAAYPQSYQNIWGLTPADRSRRSVIGCSVLLPILPRYEQDSALVSLADKRYFTVSFLDELPAVRAAYGTVDLQSLIMPPERMDASGDGVE